MAQANIKDDLWQKAYDSLSPSVIAKLDPAKSGVRNIAASLRVANTKYKLAKKKRWKVKKPDGSDIFLRDVFEKIVHWIDRFKSIGDNATQFDPVHAALPWAAVRFVLQAAVNESLVHASMVEDLELTASIVTRFREIESLYRDTRSPMLDQIEQALVESYISILDFLATAVRFFDDSTMTRMLKAPFRTVDERARDVILAKEAAVLKLARLIDGERLSGIEKLVIRLADASLSSQQEVEEKLYHDVLHWLSDVPYSRIHHGISKGRTPGTGEWLLQDQTVESWLTSSCSSRLLLHGIPGCGKTVLCSTLIDKQLASLSTSPDAAPLAYFYCTRSESERERRSPEGVLRCLARQLTVSTSPTLRIHSTVVTRYQKLVEEAKLDGFSVPKAGLSDCVSFILAALEDNPATIIIDALDENDDPKTLIDALDDVVSKSLNVVKVAVTSRDDSTVLAIMSTSVKVRITEDRNRADIMRFATQYVDRAISDYKLLRGSVTQALKDDIVGSLAQGAGEMFRWVELQVQRLCHIKLESDIRDALSSLDNSTLQDLYQEAYLRIAEGGHTAHQIAVRTFSWLLYAEESLSPKTFLTVLIVALEPQQIDIDGLQALCRGFMYLDTQSNVFRFAHHSAQEFLRRQTAFAPASAHSLIGLSCLSICRNPPVPNITEFRAAERVYDYAAVYLGHHCAAAELQDTSTELSQTLDRFLFGDDEPDVSFLIWMDSIRASYPSMPRAHRQNLKMQVVSDKQFCPLFCICAFGLSSVLVHHQWPADFDWNQRNDYGQSSLYIAAFFGYSDIVAFLLAKGADVNVEGGRLGSALHCSVFRGHIKVLQILLGHGADMQFGSRFDNALQAACRGAHEEVALVLLDRDFDGMTGPDIESLTAAFSEAGFTRALARLHKHPLTSTPRPTQLLETGKKAIMSGKVANLRYWLRTYALADIVPVGSLALSALHGHEAMTTFLIDSNISVEEVGDLGNPLRCASMNGHNHVCRILLEHGADVNSNGPLGSALHAAAIKGNFHTAKLLLEFGADVNAQGGFYGTCLQASAFHGHKELVSCFLTAGARLYDRGFSEDPFHAASEGGRHDIITLLFDAGYKPLSPSGMFQASVLSPGSLPQNLLRDSSPSRDNGRYAQPHMRRKNPQAQVLPSRAVETNATLSLSQSAQESKAYIPRSPRHKIYYLGEERRLSYALEAAAAHGHLKVVSTILEQLDDQGRVSEAVEEAILAACQHNRIEIIEHIFRWAEERTMPIKGMLCKAAHHGNILAIQKILQLVGSYQSRLSDLQSMLISSITATTSIFHAVLELVRDEVSENDILDMQQDCLLKAARWGAATDTVKDILAWNTNIERGNVLAALKTACHGRNVRVVKVLFQTLQSSSVNSETLTDCLMIATENGYAEVVEYWLPYARAHVTREHFQYMILQCAGNGRVDILRVLLENAVNDVTSKGSTIFECALGISARHGDHESCELLISKGADPTKLAPTSTDDAWKNAIDCSILGYGRFYGNYGYYRVPRRSRHPTLNSVERDWMTEDEAARDMTLRLLLQSVARPNVGTAITADAVCTAVSICSLAVLSLLLDYGADPEARSKGRKAIEYAADRQTSPLPFVRALIDAGACIKQPMEDLRNALTAALSSFPAHHGDPQRQGDLLRAYDTMEEVFVSGPGALVQFLLHRLPEQKANEDAYAVLLQCAAVAGQEDCVNLLIQRHVNVNQTGSYYGTALQAASYFGKTSIVQRLLNAGADPNIIQGRHHSALVAATIGGHIDIVLALIRAGADVNQRQPDGEPLIIRALMTGDEAVVDAFVAAGVDVRLEDKTPSMFKRPGHVWSRGRNGRSTRTMMSDGSILTAAASSGNLRAVHCLLKYMPRISIDELSDALADAVQEGKSDVMEILLNAGAMVFDIDRNIDVPTLAATCGHCVILHGLLETLSRVGQAQDACERISQAVPIMNIETFEMLLDYIPCNEAMLAEACRQRFDEIVRVGLEQGLSGNTCNSEGRPILHIAAAEGSASLVQLLLEFGADPNRSDYTGIPPLLAALEGYGNNDRIYGSMNYDLRQRPSKLIPRLTFAREKSRKENRMYFDTIDLLLTYGAHASTSPGSYGDALTVAAYLGLRDIFHILIDGGANVFTCGGVLKSPLFAAARGGHTTLLKDILNMGAVGGLNEVLAGYESENFDPVRTLLARPSTILSEGEVSQLLCTSMNAVSCYWGLDGTAKLQEGEAIMISLLGRYPSAPVTDEHLIAAANIEDEGLCSRTLASLFPRAKSRYLPEKAFVDILKRSDYGKNERLVRNLLHDQRIQQITTTMVEVSRFEAMKILLDHGPIHDVNAGMVDKICNNRLDGGRDCAELLLRRMPSLVLDESNIIKILRSWRHPGSSLVLRERKNDRPHFLGMLFDANPNLQVTEAMFEAARCSEDLEALLAHAKAGGSRVPPSVCGPGDAGEDMIWKLIELEPSATIPARTLSDYIERRGISALGRLWAYDPSLNIPGSDLSNLFYKEEGKQYWPRLAGLLKQHREQWEFSIELDQAISQRFNSPHDQYFKGLFDSLRQS